MAKIRVIQYEGDNSTFIWKHPCENFDSLTQLIVHESQEAVFFLNGEALDLFGPGRHTLSTQNIPFIGNTLKGFPFGRNPFHCEVYFINQTVQMGMKWGTDSKVRFLDPLTGVPLELGACGEMNLQVADSRKLLVKLVGTMRGISWEDGGRGFTKSLQTVFRPMISTAVKANLANTIKEENLNILEVDTHLETLSHALGKKVSAGFEEYGLWVPQFYVTTVLLPEEDPNFQKIRQLQTVSFQTQLLKAEAQVKTVQADEEAAVVVARRQLELERQTTETEIARKEAERRIIAAQAEAQAAQLAGFAEAEVMRAKGYTQKDVIQADVQKSFAQGIGNMGGNGASGSGILSDMLGLGVGLSAAGAVSAPVTDLLKGITQGNTGNIQCAKCGNSLSPSAKFCPECGAKNEPLAKVEMFCPHCGKKTPRGKFCIECGSVLARQCVRCGADIPGEAKFCPQCGTRTEE